MDLHTRGEKTLVALQPEEVDENDQQACLTWRP